MLPALPEGVRSFTSLHTDAWPAADSLPSMACVLFDQIKPADATLEDYERSVEEGITKGLY